ncbi:MAG TPA: DUF3108 domain-containing protein [Candidatus Cloacimonas sp.]|nr:DUF3108 domain-containing protein [Candidatus Cloacimonas sp.]
MTALRFWLVLLQLSGLAWASNAEYVLKAYGLKIARLQINHDEKKHSITVSANSLVTNKLFPQLNNRYLIKYRENYQPESLTRIIRQKHLSDTVVTEFDFEKGLAISTRKSDGSVSSYTIKSGTRDVFSFLAFVSTGKAASGNYALDGNGLTWTALLQEKQYEAIKCTAGKFQTRRYALQLRKPSGVKAPYVDMVTHNILSDDGSMNLWVGENKLLVSASVKRRGITTTWDLVKFEP